MGDGAVERGRLGGAEVALDPLASVLARDAVIVLDGGLATQLEASGADLRDALWSARLLVEDPEAIVRAHLDFFRAGAQLATTSSYQASFEGFAGRGIGHDAAADLLRLSVRLADEARRRYAAERAVEEPDRAAAGSEPAGSEPAGSEPAGPDALLVAASIGPYGAMLADGSEFRGRYGQTVARLRDFHRERMAILASSGADLLACETIPELEEGVALAALLEDVGATGWLSFSCADGGHLRSGAPVEEAFALADEASGVRAVGVNCTAPRHLDELLQRARAITEKPLVAYPNSGEAWDAERRQWLPPGGPGPFVDVDATSAVRWMDAGARLVGGCCRVRPSAIAEVAAAAAARSGGAPGAAPVAVAADAPPDGALPAGAAPSHRPN